MTSLTIPSSHGVQLALYVGARLEKSNIATVVIDEFLAQASGHSGAESTLLQVCGEGRDADYTVGIMSSLAGDTAALQAALLSWSNATCVPASTASGTEQLGNITVKARPLPKPQQWTPVARRWLVPRADCSIIRVVAGDSCASLATKCGISGYDFTQYNNYDANLCSTLVPGQAVCCSSGTLPDIRPQPKPNGECATYITKVSPGTYYLPLL
jgi:hypothetical protein